MVNGAWGDGGGEGGVRRKMGGRQGGGAPSTPRRLAHAPSPSLSKTDSRGATEGGKSDRGMEVLPAGAIWWWEGEWEGGWEGRGGMGGEGQHTGALWGRCGPSAPVWEGRRGGTRAGAHNAGFETCQRWRVPPASVCGPSRRRGGAARSRVSGFTTAQSFGPQPTQRGIFCGGGRNAGGNAGRGEGTWSQPWPPGVSRARARGVRGVFHVFWEVDPKTQGAP